jgi:predicted tellurium resistance membrane protein TerC
MFEYFSPDNIAALFTMENLLALLTLALLEIVLGVDNLVVIAILSGKLPREQQARARKLGLTLAMLLRIALLLSIAWIMRLTRPLFSIAGHDFSGQSLVLLGGGAFLIAKATHEIHGSLEGPTHEQEARSGLAHPAFAAIIAQILVLDLVFSLDSVITAVGMARSIPVMIVAIVIAVGAMQLFAGGLAHFIERHPTVKMLALSFLLLIGFTLVLEGFGKHVEKGYIYFSMGFSLAVEMLNIRLRKAPHAAPQP